MRTQKLYNTITAWIDDEINPNKNAGAFGELVQYFDDKSLSLIIYDANNDDRKALKTLREHYLLSGKRRIIALYSELTSLQKKNRQKYNGLCRTN